MFLTQCPPFDKWEMPHEFRIKISVSRSNRACGSYDNDPHRITISKEQCKNLCDVLETMAHEMVHLKLEIDGDPGHSEHGGKFYETMDTVCDIFGWKKERF